MRLPQGAYPGYHTSTGGKAYLNPVMAMNGPSTHADTARALMNMSTALGGGGADAPPSSAASPNLPSATSAGGNIDPLGPCEQEKNSRTTDIVPFIVGNNEFSAVPLEHVDTPLTQVPREVGLED